MEPKATPKKRAIEKNQTEKRENMAKARQNGNFIVLKKGPIIAVD